MTKKEIKIQKALGLMHTYRVYVIVGEKHHTERLALMYDQYILTINSIMAIKIVRHNAKNFYRKRYKIDKNVPLQTFVDELRIIK